MFLDSHKNIDSVLDLVAILNDKHIFGCQKSIKLYEGACKVVTENIANESLCIKCIEAIFLKLVNEESKHLTTTVL